MGAEKRKRKQSKDFVMFILEILRNSITLSLTREYILKNLQYVPRKRMGRTKVNKKTEKTSWYND